MSRIRRLVHRGRIGMAVALAGLATGCAELGIDPALVEELLQIRGAGLSESQIASGLKEALKVGTERTVTRTARQGGFLDNPLVRIVLPDELAEIADRLRSIHLGGPADELEVAMNRAAERASAEAKTIFWDAVTSMTIQDAVRILNGPDDAATVYFRSRTEDALRSRFSPVVSAAMEQVGLYRAYDELVTRSRVLSLFADPTVELNRYVTDEALDGLFTILREEEQRIRRDPAARTTELLRQVFGGLGG
ncbi:MAG: DUF4197 domain-containing protein [Myxococcota bacterium]